MRGITRADNDKRRLLDSSKAPLKLSRELSSTSTMRTMRFNQQGQNRRSVSFQLHAAGPDQAQYRQSTVQGPIWILV